MPSRKVVLASLRRRLLLEAGGPIELKWDATLGPGTDQADWTVSTTGTPDDTILADDNLGGVGIAHAINVALTEGKWYCEFQHINASTSGSSEIGFTGDSIDPSLGGHLQTTGGPDCVYTRRQGQILSEGALDATESARGWSAGERHFICVDVDSREMWAGEVLAGVADFIVNNTSMAGYPTGGLAASGNVEWFITVGNNGQMGAGSLAPKIQVIQEENKNISTLPSNFTYLGT